MPSRRYEPATLGVDLVAKSIPEGLEGEKLVHEGRVVAFHDYSERDDETEDDGLGPEPQTLADCHIVLIVDGSVGAIGRGMAHGRRVDLLGHMAYSLVVKSRHGEDERRKECC